MKRTLTGLLLGMFLAVWGGAVHTQDYEQDFQRAVEAAQNGDFETAFRLWLPMAELGFASAQASLGILYNRGYGGPQSNAEAAKWYRLAAEQGDALSQTNLGLAYYDGRGVRQDYAEALKWFRLAAEQGDAYAQTNLGLMYFTEKGVPQDFAEAVKWWRRAAEQGFAPSQTSLGVMYASGRGVIQDIVYAHMWANIAASLGDEKGKGLRDEIAREMTPEQLAEAQRLARDCVAKNYQGC